MDEGTLVEALERIGELEAQMQRAGLILQDLPQVDVLPGWDTPPYIPLPQKGGGGTPVPGKPAIEKRTAQDGTESFVLCAYFCVVKKDAKGKWELQQIEPPQVAWELELETHVSNHSMGVV